MRSVLPLVGSATEEIGVEEAIRRMEDDPELAEIARAESCYFSAQAKECVDIVKKYLTSEDMMLRLSADMLCIWKSDAWKCKGSTGCLCGCKRMPFESAQ